MLTKTATEVPRNSGYPPTRAFVNHSVIAVTAKDLLITAPVANFPVSIRRFECQASDPFAAFLRLREAIGEEQVYLLESLDGPDADKTRALIGITPLLDIVIREGRIEVAGDDHWTAWVSKRLNNFSKTDADPGGWRLRARNDLWVTMRHIEAGIDVEGLDNRRFGFGFTTLLAYDTVTYIESLPRIIEPVDGVPDAVFRIYRSTVEIDLVTDTAELAVAEYTGGFSADDVYRCLASALYAPAAQVRSDTAPQPPLSDNKPEFTIDSKTYFERVERSLRHIRAGDIYQVQLGHEVRMTGKRADLDVYLRMRTNNPSPYMAFIPVADGLTIISASPELHVRLDAGELTMRPIAGTVLRGENTADDVLLAQWLKQDEKEVAEHIMLVDLCRNDLGRVAIPGSVAVADLMRVETYSHVLHLVSTVSAELAANLDAYDVIPATFPAGTMTGAPKLRAMEIIEASETSRRGMYAGVFGVIGFGGFTNLALSIRTVVAHGDTYTARASAGVVADSTPAGEWRETLAKLSSSIHAVLGATLTSSDMEES